METDEEPGRHKEQIQVQTILETAQRTLADYLRPPPAPRDFKAESILLETASEGTLIIEPGVENLSEQVHYYWWGKGPKRLLLVHGWGGKGTQFFALIPELTAAGFQVITFDAPAHGKSTGEFSSGPAFARAIQEVASLFGPFHGVIGHSLGCAAIVIALSRLLTPEKTVLLAPLAFALPPLEHFAQARDLVPEVRAELFRLFRERYPLQILETPWLVENFSSPALIFHDPADLEVPFFHGEALASSWPGARLVPAPKTGHWSILRNKKVIESTLEFLSTSNHEIRGFHA